MYPCLGQTHLRRTRDIFLVAIVAMTVSSCSSTKIESLDADMRAGHDGDLSYDSDAYPGDLDSDLDVDVDSNHPSDGSIETATWIMRSRGPGNERLSSVVVREDGAIVAVGTHSNDEDIWMLIMDRTGTTSSQLTFAGVGSAHRPWISSSRSGGVLLAAMSDSERTGEHDIWLARLGDDDSLEWQQIIEAPGDDFVPTVFEMGNGDIIVASSSTIRDESDRNTPREIWVSRLSQAGMFMWQESIGADAPIQLAYTSAIAEGTEGQIFLLLMENVSLRTDIGVIAIDSDGQLLWHRTYGGESRDNASSIIAGDGNVVLTGQTFSFGFSDTVTATAGWVLGLTEDGEILWQSGYRADRWMYNAADQVVHAPGGGYYVCGFMSSDSDDYSSDMWVAKLNRDGVEQWQLFLGDTDSQHARSLRLDGDGVVVVGDSIGSRNVSDAIIARITAEGTLDEECSWLRSGWSLCQNTDAEPTDEGVRIATTNVATHLADFTSENTNIPIETICPDEPLD